MKKFLVLIIIFNIGIIFAREYSLSFLKLPTTAKQTALNGYIAVSDDVGGIFCNPSGLVNSSYQVGFSHNEHFQQIKYDFLGYVLPKKKYTIAFGVATLYTSRIEGRTGQDDLDPVYVNIYQVTIPEFYYDIFDIQAGISFAKRLNKKINFGTTLKFVSEKIYDVKGDTFLSDVGLQYMLSEKLNLGFVLNNFGLPVKYIEKYYPGPTQIGFGIKYKFKMFCFVSDFVKPIYDDLFINFGGEIKVIDFFLLRVGYKYKIQGCEICDDFTLGGSFGLGINYFGVNLDYSVSSFGELGLSHKISLIIEIDKVSKFYKLLREKLFKR